MLRCTHLAWILSLAACETLPPPAPSAPAPKPAVAPAPEPAPPPAPAPEPEPEPEAELVPVQTRAGVKWMHAKPRPPVTKKPTAGSGSGSATP